MTTQSQRGRAKPGTGGSGEYYHVQVRSRRGFTSFRTQDVGRKGHAQRVAGRRPSGSWSTVKWLIAKSDAHVEDGRLVADAPGARKVLRTLGWTPRRRRGDVFKAAPRPNVRERDKPTPAMRRAQRRNLAKARASRRRG